jgi:hypothetical protein
MATLFAARINANDTDAKRRAGEALVAGKVRAVLHPEQPMQHSKLFSRAIDPTQVQ